MSLKVCKYLLTLVILIMLSGVVSASTVTPSNTLQYSDDLQNNTLRSVMTVVKSVALTTDITGTIRAEWDMSTDGSNGQPHSSVFLNNNLIDVDHTLTGDGVGWVHYTANISLSAIAGDKLNLMGDVNSGYSCIVRNFRIYYDVVPDPINVHVVGNGAVTVYKNGEYLNTVNANTTGQFNIIVGDSIAINSYPTENWNLDKVCVNIECTTYSSDLSYNAVVNTGTTDYYVYFITSQTLEISQVSTIFNPTTPTSISVHWYQNIDHDINISLDGSVYDWYSYTYGYNIFTLQNLNYGTHNICVESVCVSETNYAPTPTPIPTPTPNLTNILTIVQVLGNGSVEVYDNSNMIGTIQTSHNFNVLSTHNVEVKAYPSAGYHVDKICDHTGCSSGSTKTTYIDNLDFINIAVHFISNSSQPPLPTPPPGTTTYTLTIGNSPIGMGKILLWLDGQAQSDILSSMSYVLAVNTDVEIAYYPYSGANYLKNASINGMVNTTTIFNMNKNYSVMAYWTEDITEHEPFTTPLPGETPGQNNNGNSSTSGSWGSWKPIYTPKDEININDYLSQHLMEVVMIIALFFIGVIVMIWRESLSLGFGVMAVLSFMLFVFGQIDQSFVWILAILTVLCALAGK